MEKFNRKFFDENFFLYFEEIDLCKRVKKSNGKIFLNKNIIIHHEGGGSVNMHDSIELEKNRNWHWMWSTFYFQRKYKGFFLASLLIFPKLISSFFKTIFYSIFLIKKKRYLFL